MASPKPHILLISDHGSIVGGAEKVEFRSAQELVRRGYSVSALIGSDDPDPALISDGINMQSANLEPYWERFFPSSKLEKLKTLFFDPVTYRWFRSKLESFDPKSTVVHFHTFHTHSTSSALKAAIDLGFPVVCTCHDFNLVCPISTFYNNVTNEPCGQTALSVGCWNTQCIAEGHRLFKILRNARTFGQNHIFGLLGKVKKFVMVSGHASNIITPYLPKGSNIEVVRNPVDLPSSDRIAAEANKTLLWIGRMTMEKNPEILARVASKLGWRVIFAGDGSLRQELAAKYPEHEFTGWLSPSEVSARYRESRALVMTSRWFETASLVVLDALSGGVPAVIPDISAANDWLTHGENGWVFRFDSDESLGSALENLRSDEAVRSASENAHARYWADPPTLERHVDALERIYTELLSG